MEKTDGEKLLAAARALRRIAEWDLPLSGYFSCAALEGRVKGVHDSKCVGLCHETSYSVEFGSNGARDYIRALATEALKEVLK